MPDLRKIYSELRNPKLWFVVNKQDVNDFFFQQNVSNFVLPLKENIEDKYCA